MTHRDPAQRTGRTAQSTWSVEPAAAPRPGGGRLARHHTDLLYRLRRRVRRIAVVRALQIGDLLTAVPALRSLRTAFPDAEISYVGLPWARPLISRFGYLDRFLESPGYPGIPEVEVVPGRTEAFFAEAAAYGYDLAIQLHGDGTSSNGFTRGLQARWTLGYVKPGAACPLSFCLPYPGDEVPEVLKNLWLLERIGIEPRGTHLEFRVAEEDRRELAVLPELARLAWDRPLIGLHPGARPPARRWPAERFAAVANRLQREFEAQVVILGGPGEEALARRVEEALDGVAVNLAGRTSLGALAVLIARLDLLLANDSGPSHLAAALRVPSVVLFGPASPRRWAPLDRKRHRVLSKGVECSPCTHWECPIDYRCLTWLSADDVYQTSAAQLRARLQGRLPSRRRRAPCAG